MMPGLDGHELLRALRADERTSHLPVLFLTARHDLPSRLEALTLGIDDYLVKPFEPEELGLRLRRLLEQRERTRNLVRRQLGLSAENGNGVHAENHSDSERKTISTRDQRLLDRLQELLEKHYEDPELDVVHLAQWLAMDPRTLQRKLKALTGLSPNAHIREHRLAKARELLKTTDRTITDIALSCGFASVQYFSRVFHQVHGRAPEGWRRLGKL
jgi:transcriptional regulator GlxA family with amidase domain